MAIIYNSEGITGISAAIIVGSIILIAGVAASVTMNNSEGMTEDDYEQLINDTLNEISTYIQFKDILGKYYSLGGERSIQRIAILIKPLFSIDIDMSNLLIQISNGKQIQMLYYCGKSEFVNAYPIFEHPLWNYQNESNFGLITPLDKDKSLINFSTMNDHTDIAYLTIKLPTNLQLKYGDSIQITILPSIGIVRKITIKAPAPITPIVSLL